jgi:hypothetical protein
MEFLDKAQLLSSTLSSPQAYRTAAVLFPVLFMVQRSQLHHSHCGGPDCQSAYW